MNSKRNSCQSQTSFHIKAQYIFHSSKNVLFFDSPSLSGWDRPQVQIGVAGQKVGHALKGVGRQPVAAVVGHVRHEDRDRVRHQRQEQLPALDRRLQTVRSRRVVLVNQITTS